ncbi:Heat shock 70 kDa protein 1A, partial [Tyrophagus putrescentiae]
SPNPLRLSLHQLAGKQHHIPPAPTPHTPSALAQTNACVGVFQNGKVEIIVNDHGHRVTPSIVALTDTERLIGEAAKNQAMSRSSANIADMDYWPFEVVNDGSGKPMIQVQLKGETKRFTPEEITSMVLGKLKETADAYLGTSVTDAVITVPEHFSEAQREATKNAASLAGLNVLRIISEPVAAAIACGVTNKKKSCAHAEKHVLVFHLGGATLDVSVLKVLENGVFEVVATVGNDHTGGDSFDSRLFKCFSEDFMRQTLHLKDSFARKRALRRLLTACRKAKHELSSSTKTSIEVNALFEGVFFHSAPLTRANFEELCSDLFLATLEPVKKALTNAKLVKSQIDEVILVGGSTSIPKVQALLKEEFFAGQAVAYGAALLAAALTGNAPSLVLHKNICPTPDEVTLPLSLGIKVTSGGLMSTLIKRNSVLPARVTAYLTPHWHGDHQTISQISLFEGERALARNNYPLGAFTLSGIPPMSSAAKVQVTLEVDRSGLMRVQAQVMIEEEKEEKKEKGKKQVFITKLTLNNSCLLSRRLSPEEIEQVVKEAEKCQEVDEYYRERVRLIDALEKSARQVKHVLEEAEWKRGIKGGRDQRQALKKVTAILSWLEDGAMQYAEKEEIERKRAKMVAFCKPQKKHAELLATLSDSTAFYAGYEHGGLDFVEQMEAILYEPLTNPGYFEQHDCHHRRLNHHYQPSDA